MFFFLLLGTREVTKEAPDLPTRHIRCPSCGQDVRLQPKEGQSYFHIFWIPLIPVGESRRYLQCPNCKARFSPRFGPGTIPSAQTGGQT